jgi:DinB superfamily
MSATDLLKYPIGPFKRPVEISDADLNMWMETIEQLPLKMREAINGLNADQLDTPYREEGWTLRQVVHHVADSHMNAYVRFKLALTEENPTIRPYFEERWADLPEAKYGNIEVSLRLLEALHNRWSIMLRNMRSFDWSRTFYHPEKHLTFRLDECLALYAWHSNHHVAHITSTRKNKKW